MPEIFQTFGERFREEATVDGFGFDPAILLVLLPIIAELVKKCANQSPRNLRRRGLFFGNQRKLVGALRQKFPAMDYAEAEEVTRFVFNVAENSSDQEVMVFAQACNAAGEKDFQEFTTFLKK